MKTTHRVKRGSCCGHGWGGRTLWSVLLLFAVLFNGRDALAGPYLLPIGAPPLTGPLPLTPALGTMFDPLNNPGLGIAVLPESVAVPVTTLWEIDLGRLGPGAWTAASTVVLQDTPFVDKLHFRIPLNFNAAPAGGLWDLWVLFGASPWGNNVAFHLNSIDFFHTTPALPEPFALSSYAYDVILTNSSNVVVDVLDPVLIIGSPASLANAGLQPNVPFSTVPESGSLLVPFGLAAAALFGMARRISSVPRSRG
jgi:hypothetical protein